MGLWTGREFLDGWLGGLAGGELEANFRNVLKAAPTGIRVQPELHGNLGQRTPRRLPFRYCP